MSVDLHALQYPRFLHRGEEFNLLVSTSQEAAEKLSEGWTLRPGETPELAPVPIPVVEVIEVAEEAPIAPKRGPGRPRRKE